MRRLQSILCLICGLALAALIAACAATGADDAAEGDAPEDSVPELDLDTLQADTPEGTLQAMRADNSYVGPLDEGQAIGIAFLDDVTAGESNDLQREIVVYLYDRDCIALMIGEVDSEGAAKIESDEHSDFDATVEVVMEDDAVSGTVTLPGEQPTPYTAEPATGVGGVYWADGTDEEPDVRADWVVFPDERQWGCVCIPPGFNDPCCHMERF